MAQGYRFDCTACDKSIDAWDDGNPYFIDETGKKQYAYHPNSNRHLCIGNDSPHLCLLCGKEFMIDSRAPIEACPRCASPRIVDTYDLHDQPCPFCRDGHFEARGSMIS